MYIWGNGTLGCYERAGEKYIAGIPSSVYQQLGLPVIDGKQVDDTERQDQPGERGDGQSAGSDGSNLSNDDKPEKENEQVLIALAEVDRWIEQKD